MADVPDWLLDVSGAALGINKGATLAADPYRAWDAVQKTGIENRNLEAEQLAREGLPNWYGNRAIAADTATQLATSKSLSDIYGTDTALAMQKALGPGSAFQAEIQARGLTPDMPEYMLAVQKHIGQYNPQAGIAAESLFKIPETQNRNTMDQLNTAYVQAYARMKDPNAIAVRQPDGTFRIYGSHGEDIPVNADQLVKIVSFMKGDPSQVMNQALEAQQKLQVGNAAMVTALSNWAKNTLPKIGTNADLTRALDSVRVGRDRAVAEINKQITDLKKGVDWGLKSPAEQQALLAPLEARKAEVDALRDQAVQQLQDHATRLGIPFASVRPGATVNPTGGSTVDARPFTSIVDAVRAAAGKSAPGAVQAPPAVIPDPFQSPSRQQDLVPTPTPTPVAAVNPYRNFGAPAGGMQQLLQAVDLLGVPQQNPSMNFGVPRADATDLFGLGNDAQAGNSDLDQYLAALLGGQA